MKQVEYLDVLDEFGNKTGEAKTKEEIKKERGFYRIVYLWIINPKTKQILIQKRSPNKIANPDKWDATSGGHVIASESSLEAIIRETKEELGIDIKNDNILKVFEIKHDETKRNFVDVYILEKDVDIEDIVLQTEEVSSVKYFSFEELINAYNTKDASFVMHSYFKDLMSYINKIIDNL